MSKLLITGGAGFIGSNFVRYILNKYSDYQVVVYDKLTYAGRLENLENVADNPRYTFVQGDICDAGLVDKVIQKHRIEAVINFAAETHVDRSILNPGSFIQTDVYGTYVLLEAVRKFGIGRYVQVGTDEVYGSCSQGSFSEVDRLGPSSPYSASKAGADLLVLSYFVTWGLPVVVTRSSNNFGPFQYPEKLIPLFITNAIDGQPLPLYGDGLNVRDWLYVFDNCEAIDLVLHQGQAGEIYNIGADQECTNLEVTELILKTLNRPRSLIRFVKDRPGHDRRYSLNCSKIRSLDWRPQHRFETALAETVRWYQDNQDWWRKIKSGEFRRYYEKQYGKTLTGTAEIPGKKGKEKKPQRRRGIS